MVMINSMKIGIGLRAVPLSTLQYLFSWTKFYRQLRVD